MNSTTIPLRKIDACRWEISVSYKAGMRVPGLIFADEKIIPQIHADQALEQVANVAHLPCIVRYALAPWIFSRRVRLLKDRLLEFACQGFKNRTWKRLSKRLIKYGKEIFTFLDVPGLPSDNNHAERMIRPNVIFRKISFQNMSRKGADAHEVLMSLLQTLRLQHRNVSLDFSRPPTSAIVRRIQFQFYPFSPPAKGLRYTGY